MDKGHHIVSTIKSAIRIFGCFIALLWKSINILIVTIILAEIFGLIEENVRKF